MDELKQRFPRAAAWGQAVSQPGGIVNDKARDKREAENRSNLKPSPRPKRKLQLPYRLAGPEWALGLVTI